MRAVRSVLATTAMLAAILAAAAVVGPAPAHAFYPDPPCEWDVYRTHSTCDGLDPYDWPLSNPDTGSSACGGTPLNPYTATVRTPGGTNLAKVWLYYQRGTNGQCRMAWAYLTILHPDANCYAKVERTSDQQAYLAGATYGVHYSSAHTNVVYDANVTAYAWAHCTYGSGRYSAGTPAY